MSAAADARSRIIARAARELHDGTTVNLGIGMPTLLADQAEGHPGVLLHSENGLLGIGPYPLAGEEDPDLINAGKETVTAVRGASFFDSADSFAMIRGGHIDLAVLGGMQVSQDGDLANWMVPGRMVKGMGGAMDLVSGARRVVVIMEHLTREGESKVKRECTLPLTGRRVVDRLITDLATFDFPAGGGMVLVELEDGVTLDQLRERTEAEFDSTRAAAREEAAGQPAKP
jgi:3-oxoacid CoA-transferase subunit B